MIEGIRVISTVQIDEMLPTGQTRQIYRAHVETGKGAQGILRVPKDQWNKEDLPGLLEAKRDELDLAFSIAGQ